MVGRVASSSAFLGLAFLSIGTPDRAWAADIPLPTGSYLQSCKVVSFDTATGDLAANCDGPPVGMFGLGTPETSHMNVRGCKEGTIWNDQRQLYCLAAEAWGNDRRIPDGSYIATCTDRKVVGGALLTAVCDNGNGVPKNASLDLRTCIWGGDISNNGAILNCQRPPLKPELGGPLTVPGQGVAKPVAIEPGVVKPVTVAPLTPAPDETVGEKDERDKKKKRRRERGERGERG
jgi:hypothetical protein